MKALHLFYPSQSPTMEPYLIVDRREKNTNTYEDISL
jgi:hypothetical protein